MTWQSPTPWCVWHLTERGHIIITEASYLVPNSGVDEQIRWTDDIMNKRLLIRAAVVLVVAVGYLSPLLLVEEGVGGLPEDKRQLGLEALAMTSQYFGNLEQLWITRYRLLSFSESYETFVVRAYILFGVPYSDVEVRPRGRPVLKVVHPRLWWLRWMDDHEG